MNEHWKQPSTIRVEEEGATISDEQISVFLVWGFWVWVVLWVLWVTSAGAVNTAQLRRWLGGAPPSSPPNIWGQPNISRSNQIFQGPTLKLKTISSSESLLCDQNQVLSSWKLIWRLKSKDFELSPNKWWRFRWMIIQKRLGSGISFPAVCFLFCFLEFSLGKGSQKNGNL